MPGGGTQRGPVRAGLEGPVVKVGQWEGCIVDIDGVLIEAHSLRGAPLCEGDWVVFVDDHLVDPAPRPNRIVGARWDLLGRTNRIIGRMTRE